MQGPWEEPAGEIAVRRLGSRGRQPLTGGWAEPWFGELLRDAAARAPRTPELAVVIAQSAVELYIERAVATLMRQRGIGKVGEVLEQRMAPWDLYRGELRRLWNALAGDALESTPIWAPYIAHVERRRAIGGRGARITPSEAGESVRAALALVVHVQTRLEQVLRTSLAVR